MTDVVGVAGKPPRLDTNSDNDQDAGDGSPDSRRSQLSLDDLSSQNDRQADVAGATHKVKRRHSGRSGDATAALDDETDDAALDTTKRVESKLRLNLKQQQAHYARQRRLFDEIQSDSVTGLSPSQFSSSSKSDDDGDINVVGDASGPSSSAKSVVLVATPPGKSTTSFTEDARSKRFQLQLQQLQHELHSSKRKQQRQEKTGATNPRVSRCDSGDEIKINGHDEDDGVDTEAIERLQRKAKSIATYHARIATSTSAGHYYSRSGVGSGATTTAVSHSRRLSRSDDPLSQDASNEALRKQLELLRRLQLENNRFRHENRSLREQNDVLEDQSTLHTREITRLTDEISDLAMRVQHDQMELATAAQNVRKMKQIQKQLTSVQTENDQLTQKLQDAADQDAQLRLRTQNEVESMVQETKHLKRSLRQSKQQETRLQEQSEELRSVIEALERESEELKRQLLEAQRDSSTMATKLSEKTSQIEVIESSATQCVEKMEAGMEALQKAHNSERDKRKKLEKLRDTLQNQMGTLEHDHTTLQERVRELELFNAQLQQRVTDWKLEKKQDKQFQDDRLAEFQDRLKNDAKTIGNLRDECATYEQQLETARTAVVEGRREVAVESNALRKEVEALRNYIEDAQRAPLASTAVDSRDSSGSNNAVAPPPVSTRQRREELWVQLPELQFLQGAVGGLRNEMMNFVNDFHRARHHVRQQNAKLSTVSEKVVELEHLRSEDGILIKELKDQRVLAEQAREITLAEKMEILKWSQATCEKNEQLENELAKCQQSATSLTKKVRRVRELTVSTESIEETTSIETKNGSNKSKSNATKTESESETDTATRVMNGMEREVQHLISRTEQLFDERNTALQESAERQQRVVRLQSEMESQRQDHSAIVREMETLHARGATEKQQLFTESLREMESHKDTLEKALADEREALEAMQRVNETLEAQLRELQRDVPVLASLLQLFTLVVPSLVLQVNDLLTQKRVLLKENADFAAAHDQVECIGQVLRELVPCAVVHHGSSSSGGSSSDLASDTESYAEQLRVGRKKAFRRVVVAVFALNRFQRGGFSGGFAGTGETTYGTCTSLKPMRATKKKKTQSLFGMASSGSSSGSGSSSISCLPPQTMIKVLPLQATLSRLPTQSVLDRLRAMELPSKLSELLDGSSTGETSFGSLLVLVLTTIDPASKELLVENTAGVFHCRALLERRKAARHSSTTSGSSNISEDARMATVDLIRKRILALGKRLEDLHYQRNALQKENYEFQFQLEQQATQLKELDVAIQKNEDIQVEIQQLQHQQKTEASQFEAQLAAKERELETKTSELAMQKSQIERLTVEISTFETQISDMHVEKTELHHALVQAKAASASEEEQLHKSRLGMDKQAEEVKNLRQAAKRAHEMHQKVAWRLEQELLEKANLESKMEHLRRQKETLEMEVSKAKVRAVDSSFDDERDDEHEAETTKTHRTHTAKTTATVEMASPASSTSSYDRHLQDLTDRIARIRTATPLLDEMETTSGGLRYHHAAGDDGDGDDDEDDAVIKQSSHSHRHGGGRGGGDDDGNSFRSEWQRLDISGVFDDGAGASGAHETSHSHHSKPPTDQKEKETETQAARRGLEIDKVNSAVHDYMDRIDEKLQQMYGIPRSSNRQRPATTDAIIHGVSSSTHTTTSNNSHAKTTLPVSTTGSSHDRVKKAAAQVRWSELADFDS